MKNFIKKLQQAYNDGKPLVSNEEYDALVKRFPDAEKYIGTAGDIEHIYRMWSLQKKYPSRGDILPDLTPYVKTPKLDGCAVDVLYVDGKFTQALTRGDGVKGKDITNNIKHLVPDSVGTDMLIIQITGEVVPTKEVENRRNFASGAVNIKDENEFIKRIDEGGLSFIAYGVQIVDTLPGVMGTFKEDMSLLAEMGFSTVLCSAVKGLCDTGCILTDGEVYRLNSNSAFQKAGFTSKFPKGAFAVKEDASCVWTTLREVVFQVGASGKVTPVGIVDEIVLEDAKITRVTLNNIEYMAAMGITHIGQRVGIIRAGGIIPKIVEVEAYEDN